jgi:hypothetical protein
VTGLFLQPEQGLRVSAQVGEPTRGNTQIYEGTNQIQRVVMARQLLK